MSDMESEDDLAKLFGYNEEDKVKPIDMDENQKEPSQPDSDSGDKKEKVARLLLRKSQMRRPHLRTTFLLKKIHRKQKNLEQRHRHQRRTQRNIFRTRLMKNMS